MKILSFSAYYIPEIAASMYITTNLFEDWADNNDFVEVYVPTPTRGVSKETVQKYKKLKNEISCDGHLIVHRFKMIQEGKSTAIRAIRYLILNLKFVFKGIRAKADIMFIDSTPPTQGIMAAFLKKVKKIPFVYNLQDMFPDSLVNTGICFERSLLFKIGQWMEHVTYKNADHIITISEDFKENLIQKGVPSNKISVVYNWVDENKVKYVDRKNNRLFDDYNLDREKFYIAYSGNIGMTQNMDMLLQVAQELKCYEEIEFVLVGDGIYKNNVERQIKEYEISNIKMIPFQAYERISEVFSLGDVGLIISKAGVGKNSIPSKTWSYMSAERTILASFDIKSELCKIIMDNGCGVCVDADDSVGLKDAIVDLYNNRIELKGNNCRQYVLENLTRSIGTHKYQKVLTNVKRDYEIRKKR